jgi:hypothetical protein
VQNTQSCHSNAALNLKQEKLLRCYWIKCMGVLVYDCESLKNVYDPVFAIFAETDKKRKIVTKKNSLMIMSLMTLNIDSEVL